MIIKPIFVDKNQLLKIFRLQITSLNINKNSNQRKDPFVSICDPTIPKIY
jgi:hypothetical protein